MEDTRIPWCDHTFNGWRGCVKISPGCEHCYADAGSKRNPAVLGVWGPHGRRVAGSEKYWYEPLIWNARAAVAGRRARVFALSLGDWLEDWGGPVHDTQKRRLLIDGDGVWRAEGTGLFVGVRDLTLDDVRLRLLETIRRTEHLDWLLLSKRVGNWWLIVRRLFALLESYDTDEYEALGGLLANWLDGRPPANVWIGASVEDQRRADERVPALLKLPARVRFLSCEPLLEAVDLTRLDNGADESYDALRAEVTTSRGHSFRTSDTAPLDWVIVGGESDQGGQKARAFDLAWARSLRDQCKAAGVAFYMKQFGSYAYDSDAMAEVPGARVAMSIEEARSPEGLEVLHNCLVAGAVHTRDRAGEDPYEWPADLRVRELPAVPAEVAD